MIHHTEIGKLRARRSDLKTLREFVAWLPKAKGVYLEGGDYTHENLIVEFLGADPDALELERRALVDAEIFREETAAPAKPLRMKSAAVLDDRPMPPLMEDLKDVEL